MADESPAAPDNPVGKKNNLKGIAFLEVGIVEVLLVILILVLFFGLLNYFNIVSLSKVYPQQFGWLPHLPLAAENRTQNQSNTIKSGKALNPNEPILKPSSASPEIIKKDMQSFVQTSLNSSLVPSSLDIKSTTGANGAILDPGRFNAYWTSGNGIVVSISASYGQKSAVQDRVALLALPQLIANLTATSVDPVAAKYLAVKAKGVWDCSKATFGGKEITKCINSWTDNNIKKEADVIGPLSVLNKDTTSVSYCERYPESSRYSWKSCSFQK